MAEIRPGPSPRLDEADVVDGPVLAAELAAWLFGCGGGLAIVGLLLPSLRPAHVTGGVATAAVALVVGATLHLTRERPWSMRALRWTVLLAALLLISAYNLATVAEPYRYSVFYFFLVLWVGLTQPQGTSLRTSPLYIVSYVGPILVHDSSRAALLSAVFVLPTLVVAGELIGWFSAHRASLRNQLEVALGELEARDERRDLFLDTASHELRSPLATIRGSLATLEDHHDRLSTEDVTRLLGMLHRQVDRMQRMVEDLLTSSRMRSGALSCHPRTVDLGEEIPRLVAPSLLDGVDLDTEALGDCQVRVDPDHLAQVLTNLLANAARYGQPPVEVTAERHGERVELSVADHGDGVAPEEVPGLFHRYEHGGDTPGLGLGLHIVRELAERNDGAVVYRDHEPHGACFVLDLPAAEPSESAAR